MVIWEAVRHRVAIAGRLTDGETGRALQGGRVEITGAPRSFQKWVAAHALQFGDRWPAMAERPDRTRTADDGHFHFLDLPIGTYTLTASRPRAGSRWGTATAEARVRKRSMAGADMTLPPTTVKGRVVRKNKAIAMAEVRVRGSAERDHSAGDGSYLLRGLETGERTLEVTAQEFPEPQTWTVALDHPGAVEILDLDLDPKPPKPRTTRSRRSSSF